MTVCANGVPIRDREPPATLPLAAGRRGGVAPALLGDKEPVPSAVGDIGELGDIDMDHRAGVRVLGAS